MSHIIFQRPQNYYSYKRTEMMSFIPERARRILDVGCADGSFGQSVKEKLNVEIWGIEIYEKAAQKAKDRLDRVIVGDILHVIDCIPDNYFDCVFFNDVLEYLVDPYKAIAVIKHKINTSNHGMLICSLPNVRHRSVLVDLVFKKQWTYRGAGVLDYSHLRFFTEKSIKDMFTASGYDLLT